MSLSQASTETCKECGDEIDRYYSPGYCSEDCFHKRKAHEALEVVRKDHKYCGTCLRRIKTVEEPTDDWEHKHGSKTEAAIKHGAEYHNVTEVGISLDVTDCYGAPRTTVESVIGFQYRTENGETVVKEREKEDGVRVEQTGTGCVCGNTDLSETVDILQECEPAVVLANFVRTFRQLEAEGKIDKRVDKDVLFSTFRETRDLTLALGGRYTNDLPDKRGLVL